MAKGIKILILVFLTTFSSLYTKAQGGLSGFISSRPSGSADTSYGYGYSIYTALWPLLATPAKNFQVGLPFTWLGPDNPDADSIILCPNGTVNSGFQSIEGGPGWWQTTRFYKAAPKFMIGGTLNCYDYGISTPGFNWDTIPPADTILGIAQLSNRFLIPPDEITFQGNTNGAFLGVGYIALPLTTAYKNTYKGHTYHIGEHSWTCFLNAANFKGPVAYYIPEAWCQAAKNYPPADGHGLDARRIRTSAVGGTMEIASVPELSSVDSKKNKFYKIPRLQFPVDSQNRSILSKDVKFYDKTAIYNQVLSWRNGGAIPSGSLKTSGAYSPKMETLIWNPEYTQNNVPVMGIDSVVKLIIINDNDFALQMKLRGNSNMAYFPQYFKDSGGYRVAIDSSQVPAGLVTKQFAAPTTHSSYTTTFTDSAWGNPGPAIGPYYAFLSDGSGVTYYWYRFIDQPVFQQFHWAKSKKDSLQKLVETLHSNWGINKNYLPPPSSGSLAFVDSALLVTPPKGFEVGYVPIATGQTAHWLIPGFVIDKSKKCYIGNSFQFTDSTNSADSVVSWSWNFGDNVTSAKKNPTHYYGLPGTYTVTLQITNVLKEKASISKTVTVYPNVIPSFSVNNNSQCILANSFVFKDQSTIYAGSSADSIRMWNWNYGDNSSAATTQNPTHSYKSIGTYKVALTTTTNHGCIDSVSTKITVSVQPVASFSINTVSQCEKTNVYTFTDKSTVSSGSIAKWTWYFGDGDTDSTQNPSYSYKSPGIYSVQLTATSNNGCASTTTIADTVFPYTIPDFVVNNNPQCLIANSFVFKNKSMIYAGSSDIIRAWSWNYGDSSIAVTTQNPTHTYKSAGTYNVILTTTTNHGCIDTISEKMTVIARPVAAFSVNKISQCEKTNVYTFTDKSTVVSDNIAKWAWNFGDINLNTSQNPSHTYKSPGIYSVQLTATSSNGCVSFPTTITDTVSPDAVPYFVVNNNSQCLFGNKFAFKDSSKISTGSIFSWQWNFGDAASNTFSSTITAPVHSYKFDGLYLVKLKITSEKGCADSIYKSIVVNPTPAPFILGDSAKCAALTDFYTSGIDSAAKYNWKISGGNIVSGGNTDTVHVFWPVTGTGILTVFETTYNGCIDSVQKTITVNPSPIADWKIKSTQNATIDFIAKDTTLATSAYVWNLGDGTSLTGYNISHAYQKNKSYTVKLVTTGADGCTSEFDSTINVTVSGINESSYSLPGVDINIYPNPFQNSTTIHYKIGFSAPVRIELFDVDGKQLGTILNEKQTAGIYNYDLNASKYDLKPGMYFVRFYINDNLVTKQVVKL